MNSEEKDMRKFYRRLAAFLLIVSVLVTPSFARAAETDADSAVVQGEDVEIEDLGSGVTMESYVEYVDALSPIEPRTATQGNAVKYTNVKYNDVYVCTLVQTATFVYGAPNAVVTISSKSGKVYSYDAESPYRVGTITTTAANGSPATVTSSFGIFRASDWSRLTGASVTMYCYNSGLYN